MFQSENEDLIPRCAPKPSAETSAGFHPSVPEISIVLTQKESSGQLTCPPPTVVTSYSVWKNKCLPTVSYQPETESFYPELSSTSKLSNVYPMRAEAVVVPSMNYTAGQIALPKTDYSDVAGKNAESTLKTRYSIESQNSKFCPRCILTSSYNRNSENGSQEKQTQPYLSANLEENIPTISAGTQTDNFFQNTVEPNLSTLATKEDIAEIKSMIVGMERHHRHLLETLKNLLEEKHKLSPDTNKINLSDVGTQNDKQPTEVNLIQKPSHIRYDLIEEVLNEKENNNYEHKSNIQTSEMQSNSTAIVPGTPKTASDQSIVMNELAVKYLPNGKLNDMLQEVLIGTKVQNQYKSPLINKESLDKNPTDLSTASYKYLTKYRLLPEENNIFSQRINFAKLNSEDKQENLLDLEMIRCKPKFM